MASSPRQTDTRAESLQISFYYKDVTRDEIEQHAKILSTSETLDQIDICCATFPPKGLITLAQGVKLNKTLGRFRLVTRSEYDCTARGTEPAHETLVKKRGDAEDLTALGDALATHPTLTHLVTNGLLLNDLEMKAFASAFSSPHLQSIDLSQAIADPSSSLQKIVDAVASCNLQFFSLNRNKLNTEHIPLVAKIIETTACKELFFNSNQLSNLAPLLAAAAKNPHLKTLSLDGNKISSCDEEEKETIGTYLKRASLDHLSLSYNPLGKNIAEALAEGLSEHPCLHTLDLTKTNVHQGAVALFQALKTNRSLLEINWNNGSLALEQARNLHGRHRRQAPVLPIEGLADAMYEGLFNNPTLQILRLNENPLGPNAMRVLAKAIENVPRKDSEGNDLPCGISGLKMLSLLGTQAQEGAASLMASLRYNTILEDLNLENNAIDGSETLDKTQRFLYQLGYTLSRNQTLKKLSIGENRIGPITEIAQGLSVNSSLTSLDLGLRYSCIGPESPILSALETNKSILQLIYNSILVGKKVSETIERFLDRNKQLLEQQPATSET